MKFKLNIPEPCHEDWQQMSPTQKGKFCASCQKEVIDFTKLSSPEIARKTKNSTQLCGRFTSPQLEQEYISFTQNSLSRLGIALGLGSIIAVAQPSFAQEEKSVKVKVYTENDLQYKESTQATTQQDSITIKGIVTDDEGLPLPGVNVLQQNSSNSTHTDFDGNFEFSIYKPYNIDNDVVLVFSSIGMEDEYCTINTEIKSHSLNIKMTGFVLGELIVSKPNIFQRFLNLFRSKENKHY